MDYMPCNSKDNKIFLVSYILLIELIKAFDIDTLAHLTDALTLPASFSCIVVQKRILKTFWDNKKTFKK